MWDNLGGEMEQEKEWAVTGGQINHFYRAEGF